MRAVEFTPELIKRRILGSLAKDDSAATGIELADSHASANNGAQHAIDLSGLFRIPEDDEFIRAAYRAILGRECDISGFLSHLQMLRSGTPRAVVAAKFVRSEEARGRGEQFTGIPSTAPVVWRWNRFGMSELRSLWGEWRAKIRLTLRSVVREWRMDLIQEKIDYIAREMEARFDQLSEKTDQAAWGISTKLDAGLVEMKTLHLESLAKIRDLNEDIARQAAEISALRQALALKPGPIERE